MSTPTPAELRAQLQAEAQEIWRSNRWWQPANGHVRDTFDGEASFAGSYADHVLRGEAQKHWANNDYLEQFNCYARDFQSEEGFVAMYVAERQGRMRVYGKPNASAGR